MPRNTDKSFLQEMGKKLYFLRKLQGITQQNLANELGVSFQQIQKYERGENNIPPNKLYKASLFFEVQINYLFPEPSIESLPGHLLSDEEIEIIALLRRIQNPALYPTIKKIIKTLSAID